MSLEILLRYLHFISIFAIVATLTAEHLLIRKTLTRSEIKRISIVDAVYGISALVLLGAGLTLWLSGVGKPSEYYSSNWIFHLKITLVGVVGIVSIYPTIFFIKNGKGDPTEVVTIPKSIFWMLRLELVIVFILPLLAGLMARGIGFFG